MRKVVLRKPKTCQHTFDFRLQPERIRPVEFVLEFAVEFEKFFEFVGSLAHAGHARLDLGDAVLGLDNIAEH
jgi:hypothetical protein